MNKTPETEQEMNSAKPPLETELENQAQMDAESTETSELEELKAKAADWESKHQYLYAEFETFKRRTIKERSDLIKFGPESLIKDLLGVMDNLERAIEHSGSENSVLIDGVKMTLKQFQDALHKKGVTLVETEGKNFDPHFHEAVGQENSELAQGKILRTEQKGYSLHGRLLRPARVILSAGPKETKE